MELVDLRPVRTDEVACNWDAQRTVARVICPNLLQRMCQARRRLQLELEPSMAISQLAGEAGLSTAHFITQFRAIFGNTPLQCRTRARLERAREQLLASEAPVTQIALALGFSNAGSFSRLFTKHYGIPPRHYRRYGTPSTSPAGCVALMNHIFREAENSAKSPVVP